MSAQGFALLLALATYTPLFSGLSYGQRLLLTAFGSLAVWFPVMLLTRPETPATLDAFYRRVRPGGAWGPVRERVGLVPLDGLTRDARRWLLWVTLILGGTLALGWVILG